VLVLSLIFTIRQIEEDWDETPYVFLHNILGSDPSSLGTVLNKLNSDRLQWLARHIIHRHGSATVNLDDLPTFWKYVVEYKRDLPESFLATSTLTAAQTEDLFRGASQQKRSGRRKRPRTGFLSTVADDSFAVGDEFSASDAAAAASAVLGKANETLQRQEERSKAAPDGDTDYRSFVQQNGAADSSEARKKYEARNREEFLSSQDRLTAASTNKRPPSATPGDAARKRKAQRHHQFFLDRVGLFILFFFFLFFFFVLQFCFLIS